MQPVESVKDAARVRLDSVRTRWKPSTVFAWVFTSVRRPRFIRACPACHTVGIDRGHAVAVGEADALFAAAVGDTVVRCTRGVVRGDTSIRIVACWAGEHSGRQGKVEECFEVHHGSVTLSLGELRRDELRRM